MLIQQSMPQIHIFVILTMPGTIDCIPTIYAFLTKAPIKWLESGSSLSDLFRHQLDFIIRFFVGRNESARPLFILGPPWYTKGWKPCNPNLTVRLRRHGHLRRCENLRRNHRYDQRVLSQHAELMEILAHQHRPDSLECVKSKLLPLSFSSEMW